MCVCVCVCVCCLVYPKIWQDLFKVAPLIPNPAPCHPAPCLGCERSIPLVVCPRSFFELLYLFSFSPPPPPPVRLRLCVTSSHSYCPCSFLRLWSFYGCQNDVFFSPVLINLPLSLDFSCFALSVPSVFLSVSWTMFIDFRETVNCS